MKKKTVAVMMAALMAMGMVSAVNVQAGIEDKTLIVGFDAEYPPYGYMESIQDLTWNWRRLSATWKAGNWKRSRSAGTPRTRNWTQVLSTVSGTDLL